MNRNVSSHDRLGIPPSSFGRDQFSRNGFWALGVGDWALTRFSTLLEYPTEERIAPEETEYSRDTANCQ